MADEVAVVVRAQVAEFTREMQGVVRGLENLQRASGSFPEKRKQAFDAREVEGFGRQMRKANEEFENLQRRNANARGGFGNAFRGGVVGGVVGGILSDAENNALAPFSQLAGLFGNSAVVALAPILGTLVDFLGSPGFQNLVTAAAKGAGAAADAAKGQEGEVIGAVGGFALGAKFGGPVGAVLGAATGQIIGAGLDEAGQRPDAALGAGIGGGFGQALSTFLPGVGLLEKFPGMPNAQDLYADLGAWLQRDAFGDPDVGPGVGAKERGASFAAVLP